MTDCCPLMQLPKDIHRLLLLYIKEDTDVMCLRRTSQYWRSLIPNRPFCARNLGDHIDDAVKNNNAHRYEYLLREYSFIHFAFSQGDFDYWDYRIDDIIDDDNLELFKIFKKYCYQKTTSRIFLDIKFKGNIWNGGFEFLLSEDTDIMIECLECWGKETYDTDITKCEWLFENVISVDCVHDLALKNRLHEILIAGPARYWIKYFGVSKEILDRFHKQIKTAYSDEAKISISKANFPDFYEQLDWDNDFPPGMCDMKRRENIFFIHKKSKLIKRF